MAKPARKTLSVSWAWSGVVANTSVKRGSAGRLISTESAVRPVRAPSRIVKAREPGVYEREADEEELGSDELGSEELGSDMGGSTAGPLLDPRRRSEVPSRLRYARRC